MSDEIQEANQKKENPMGDFDDLFIDPTSTKNISIFYTKDAGIVKSYTSGELKKLKEKTPSRDFSSFKEIKLAVRVLSWGMMNSMHQDSMSEGKVNLKLIKENKLKSILVKWDLKTKDMAGNVMTAPITSHFISNLHPEIAEAILAAYEESQMIGEDEEKK